MEGDGAEVVKSPEAEGREDVAVVHNCGYEAARGEAEGLGDGGRGPVGVDVYWSDGGKMDRRDESYVVGLVRGLTEQLGMVAGHEGMFVFVARFGNKDGKDGCNCTA